MPLFTIESDILQTNEDLFKRSQNATPMVGLDKSTNFNGTINGTEIEYTVELLPGANLSRLTLIEHVSPNTGQRSALVTGIVKNANFDIQVDIGNGFVPLNTLIASVLFGDEANIEQVQKTSTILEGMGMPNSGSGTLFFQHFGADADVYHNLADQGNRKPGNGRILESAEVQFPIDALEIGKVDLNRTRNGIGFVGLLEAYIQQVQRGFAMRKAASAAESQEETRRIMSVARNWASNWGGSSLRPGTTDTWDPISIPCGRLVLNSKEYSFWTRRVQNQTDAPTVDPATVDPFQG